MIKEKRMAYCTNNTQVGFHTGNGTTDNLMSHLCIGGYTTTEEHPYYM